MKNKPKQQPQPTVTSLNLGTPDEVATALLLLQGALSEEELRIREEGSHAMQAGAYDTATAVIDFAKRLLAFQAKVKEMEAEWQTLDDHLRDIASPEVQEIVSKRFFGRHRNGETTSQAEIYGHLLAALVELGGRGKSKEVVDLVGKKMQSFLKPKDFEPVASDDKQIRWRNNTAWARNTLANTLELMLPNSPHGIWEISTKGREWLKQQDTTKRE